MSLLHSWTLSPASCPPPRSSLPSGGIWFLGLVTLGDSLIASPSSLAFCPSAFFAAFSSHVAYRPRSRTLSHIWTHPALQGQCLLMAVRGTTARIYPASCLEGRCPLRHDGICALPPQHFDDLKTVIVITRLRKSRSDLSRHQDILPYATVWKGLYSVNTCAMPLLCSPQAFSCRCAPTARWSR